MPDDSSTWGLGWRFRDASGSQLEICAHEAAVSQFGGIGCDSWSDGGSHVTAPQGR